MPSLTGSKRRTGMPASFRPSARWTSHPQRLLYPRPAAALRPAERERSLPGAGLQPIRNAAARRGAVRARARQNLPPNERSAPLMKQMHLCQQLVQVAPPLAASSFPWHKPSEGRHASPQGASPALSVRAICVSRTDPHPCAVARVSPMLPPAAASPPLSPGPRGPGTPARSYRSGGPPGSP